MMEFVFLNSAGTTVFVRSDMESGHWTQQEMQVVADFPYDPKKVIQAGQRIAFRDPATDSLEMFEIINVTNTEPDHYQQITAESICIAELNDEHIDSAELTAQTAAQALATALTGTLWSVGTDTSSGTQDADFSRGSVWNAVCTIQQNWNVYITPRVTITNGAISGRYLDIAPAGGTFRGLRLSVRKNMTDPAVTYDESEVYTALYGYGGNVEVSQSQGDDKTEELTFKDVVWQQTSAHPAKPANQTYLEWPEKTALYGRNGRPRYGYYQNSSIKDAETLLQKTWESLQLCSEPKITISGTVTDLHRLGYADQPVRLHDTAIVQIEETGETFSKEIIQCDIDLVDPTGDRVEIGDYIPNIIYINRETDDKASGGGGGGGGRGPGSMTNLEDDDVKTFTEFIKLNDKIGMVIGTKDGDNYIKGGEITLSINADGGTTAKLEADTIDIDGLVEALTVYSISVAELSVTGSVEIGGEGGGEYALTVYGDIGTTGDISTGADGAVSAYVLNGTELHVTSVYVGSVGAETQASWQQETVTYCTFGAKHYFLGSSASGNLTPNATYYGAVATGATQKTIHYLGSATT
jgi:phage minor structural protein